MAWVVFVLAGRHSLVALPVGLAGAASVAILATTLWLLPARLTSPTTAPDSLILPSVPPSASPAVGELGVVINRERRSDP